MSSDRETIGEHDAQRDDERSDRHAKDQAKDQAKDPAKDYDSPGATIDDAEPAEPNEPG
jgi:hypothetical protein